jgi:flagellar basal-body rod protein FlgC
MTIPPIIQTPLPPGPPLRPQQPHTMFSALAIAASGMTGQRVRMDVVAQNLANSETTKTPDGGPYHRRTVSLEAVVPDAMTSLTASTPSIVTMGATGAVVAPGAVPAPGADPTLPPIAVGSTPIEMTNDVGGVRVAGIGEDKSEGAMVYNPGSPDADKNGYVRMPNVNITDEMIDLMNARRVYEANATVFQVARAMLHKAIDI